MDYAPAFKWVIPGAEALIDKYQDIDAALERDLLKRPEPPSHVRAGGQLKEAKISYKMIVSVGPEAILYVDKKNQAWTAWSEVRESGTLVFYRQKGFPAWPSPYLKDE